MISKRRAWQLIAAGVLILAFWLAFSPVIRVGQAQRLDAARTRWQAAGIDSYQAMVEVRIGLGDTGDYRLTIQNGEVVAADWRMWPELVGDTAEFSRVDPERAEDYTIDALFDRAARSLDRLPAIYIAVCGTRYTTDFDESLGYISYYARSDCQRGLLCPSISECSSSYRVTRFEVIESE